MFKAVKYVLGEHKDNIVRIYKIALAHMGKQTIKTSLGLGWVFVRDIVYLIIFVIFRTYMSGDAQIDGMHRVVYLITGLSPWFFMNEVLNSGANAIKHNKGIIMNIKFPISIIPTIEVMAIFIKRLMTMAIVFIIILYFGYFRNFNIVLFVYYMLAMLILMVSLNLIISALVAISSDIENLYGTITRILFFSLPILWSFEKVDYLWISSILRSNPMVYIIMGFRDVFIHNRLPDLEYTLYFWICTIMILGIGCIIQFKLRKYYTDFL